MSAQPRRRNGEGHQYKGLSLVILVISFLGRMLALRRNRQAFSPTTSAVSPRGEPGEAPEIRGEDGQDSVRQSPHGRRSRRQLHCCGTRGSIAGHSRLILPVGLIMREPRAATRCGGWARDIRGSRATGETLGCGAVRAAGPCVAMSCGAWDEGSGTSGKVRQRMKCSCAKRLRRLPGSFSIAGVRGGASWDVEGNWKHWAKPGCFGVGKGRASGAIWASGPCKNL